MHVMNADAALQRAAQGMQFIAVASELRMMTAKAEEFLKTLKPEAQAKDVARY
jgi:4-hydroxy-2-oxoheptanedioate aldolase